MACKGDTTKSRHLAFDPGGMSTINWRILYQDSESNKALAAEYALWTERRKKDERREETGKMC